MKIEKKKWTEYLTFVSNAGIQLIKCDKTFLNLRGKKKHKTKQTPTTFVGQTKKKCLFTLGLNWIEYENKRTLNRIGCVNIGHNATKARPELVSMHFFFFFYYHIVYRNGKCVFFFILPFILFFCVVDVDVVVIVAVVAFCKRQNESLLVHFLVNYNDIKCQRMILIFWWNICFI